ncbi:MAG: tetratricopeptide repeat protein [Candidatus Krumholzibacteria bacterium]|nr:tetratricopeptide repeat protein [Candidatus Krumholzibacteria bacterium]
MTLAAKTPLLAFLAATLSLTALPAAAQLSPDGQPPPEGREVGVWGQYTVGVFKMKMGRVLEAVDHLEYAWRLGDGEPAVGLMLAEAYYLLRNFTRCEMVLDDILDRDAEHTDALVLKAKVRWVKRDRRSAVLCLERARETRSSFETERLLGNMYKEIGEHEKAIEAYERCLAYDASYPYLWYRYGELLAQAGRRSDAQTALRRAMEADPSFVEPAIDLARMHVEDGHVEDAIVVLEGAVDKEIGNDEAVAMLANLYLETGRHHDGIVLLERRRAVSPLPRDAEVLLGRTYFESGRLDDAREVFETLLAREPRSAELARIVAEIHARSGDPAGARVYYERAISIAPADYRSYLALFFAASPRFAPPGGRVDLPEEDLRGLLHEASALADRADFEANYMLGLALGSAAEYDLAREHLLRAHAINADDRSTILNLANVAEKQLRFDEAERYLVRLYEMDPDDPAVCNFYGYVLAEMRKDLERARALVEHALAAEPDNGYYLDSLGWIYYQMGDYVRAVRELERASAVVAADPVILEHLGDAYAGLRRFEEAKAAYERSSRLQEGNAQILEKIESAARHLE